MSNENQQEIIILQPTLLDYWRGKLHFCSALAEPPKQSPCSAPLAYKLGKSPGNKWKLH